jgi:cytochrome c-type biogenesis protein CcmH
MTIRWSLLMLALVAGLAVLIAAPSARAVEPDEILNDAVLEARARKLSAGLRCLVCQNQSIDDSNAPLARDLRLLVRERLKVGDSDADVLQFVVARYGEFVLLQPRLGRRTVILWLAPIFILLAIGIGFFRRFRQPKLNADQSTPEPLSSSERSRLDKLLRADVEDAPPPPKAS